MTSLKAKSKSAAFPKPAQGPAASSSPEKTLEAGAQQAAQQPATKTTLADWTAEDDDVNGFYAGEKRQRGGRKKKKKNREEAAPVQDWDDIYDPSRPTNYADYKGSEEEMRAIREWKDHLYAHRMARRTTSDFSSDTEDRDRMRMNSASPMSLVYRKLTRASNSPVCSAAELLLRAASRARSGTSASTHGLRARSGPRRPYRRRRLRAPPASQPATTTLTTSTPALKRRTTRPANDLPRPCPLPPPRRPGRAPSNRCRAPGSVQTRRRGGRGSSQRRP